MSAEHEAAVDRDFESDSDEDEPEDPAVDEDPRDLGLELDAAQLKATYAKVAKLISVAETQSERVLKSILSSWTGAERRGAFLWLPLSVLGLAGGAIRVRIAKEEEEDEEEEEEEAADEEEEAADEEEEAFEPPAEEAASSDSDSDAPEPKKQKLSCPQEARSLFQHADVKLLLHAALGDSLSEANAAACEAVERAERTEAEARLRAAQEIKHEKKRALEVARAEKQLERVGRAPKSMPRSDAGPGETKEKIGQVLSQLGGNLWHLAKRNLAENGAEALAALVEVAKDRPAALLESEAFKVAFKAATGSELPVLGFKPCAGCRSLGCKRCRGAPLPPTEVDGR
jgi:hypothetical protein